jgi:soluble lytic murein transglycosylase-like protein
MRLLKFVVSVAFAWSLCAPIAANASESPLEFLMKRTTTEAAAPGAASSKSTRQASRPVSRGRSAEQDRGGNAAVAEMIRREAARQGVPTAFAVAVARVESGLRCRAVGRAGELGPFQVKVATARGIGFRGAASALNSCGAGIVYGIRHLRLAYQRCRTTTGAAALHNGGLGASCRSTAYTRKVASRH